jgi:hypothetical protein
VISGLHPISSRCSVARRLLLLLLCGAVLVSCGSESDLSFLPVNSAAEPTLPLPATSTTLGCALSDCDQGEELISSVTTAPVVLPRCDEYAYNDTLPLEYCEEGRGIMYAQQILVRYGYEIEADSYFGPASYAAVRDFQARKGLPVTGRIDTETWRALDPNIPQQSFPGTDLNGDGLVTPNEFGE